MPLYVCLHIRVCVCVPLCAPGNVWKNRLYLCQHVCVERVRTLLWMPGKHPFSDLIVTTISQPLSAPEELLVLSLHLCV